MSRFGGQGDDLPVAPSIISEKFMELDSTQLLFYDHCVLCEGGVSIGLRWGGGGVVSRFGGQGDDICHIWGHILTHKI